MIALAVALAEIAMILTQRVRKPSGPEKPSPWPYMAVGLGACAIGWLAVGRPGFDYGELCLALVCGVILTAEAALAAGSLTGRSWAAWTTAGIGGAAAATWLLSEPWPFV
ncbi:MULTISPECIES: hypothetical protein [unclassified Streptomyces]|uniref:hypothetical protein n=1 Tax=unclassified Streptomyces TaxID=2593676 RepID=UPI00365EB8B1